MYQKNALLDLCYFLIFGHNIAVCPYPILHQEKKNKKFKAAFFCRSNVNNDGLTRIEECQINYGLFLIHYTSQPPFFFR